MTFQVILKSCQCVVLLQPWPPGSQYAEMRKAIVLNFHQRYSQLLFSYDHTTLTSWSLPCEASDS